MSKSPPQPSPMDRVRRIAHWMRGLALAGGLVLAALTVGTWSSPEWIRQQVLHEAGLANAQITITPAIQLAGGLVAMLPLGLGLYALLQVWMLFGEYARGSVFSAQATGRLRRLAWALIWVCIAQVLARTGHAVLLTMLNPPGKKLLVIALNSNDYILLLFGILLLAIAWVMVEASRIAQENAEFV